MMEQGYPKNVFVGNKPMRGYDAHDKRFDLIDNNPACSLKYKTMKLPQWQSTDPDKSKTMNFDLPSYCNNSYMPDITPISAKLDIGSKFFDLLIIFRDSIQHVLRTRPDAKRRLHSETGWSRHPKHCGHEKYHRRSWSRQKVSALSRVI